MRRFSALCLGTFLALAGCSEQPTSPQAVTDLVASAEAPPSLSSSGIVQSLETTGRHVVAMQNQRVTPSLARTVDQLGGTIEVTLDPIGVVVVSGLLESAARQLERDRSVSWVSPDYLIPLDLPDHLQVVEEGVAGTVQNEAPGDAFFFPRQWNLRAIGADRVWGAGRLGSPDVTVAILDTGLDYLNPDLVGLVDLDRSRSFVTEDDASLEDSFPGAHPVADLHWHGTHVGATVSSNALIAAGVTSRTTLMGVKVCNASGSCPVSAILQGIIYAADSGAHVMNLSLGGYYVRSVNPGLPAVFNNALNYANRQGSVVVVASGNHGVDLDRNRFSEGERVPSLYASYCDGPNTVCVAGTGPVAADGPEGPWYNVHAPAFYSNFGRSAIDVSAPGGTSAGPIWATCSTFSLMIDDCRTPGVVIGAGGTSMAAPHVAAVAALVVEDVGPNRPGLVRQRLHQTARDLGQPGTDPYHGKGRVNAARAVGLN